ncbi:unnamed protein product [Parajaminaea phylloscopi]
MGPRRAGPRRRRSQFCRKAALQPAQASLRVGLPPSGQSLPTGFALPHRSPRRKDTQSSGRRSPRWRPIRVDIPTRRRILPWLSNALGPPLSVLVLPSDP